MAFVADAPVTQPAPHIPVTPAARLPVQNRLGGGSFATQVETFRPASDAEETDGGRRAVDQEDIPREASTTDLLAARMRIELARQRPDDVSSRGEGEEGKEKGDGDQADSFGPALERRLMALLGNDAANHPSSISLSV